MGGNLKEFAFSILFFLFLAGCSTNSPRVQEVILQTAAAEISPTTLPTATETPEISQVVKLLESYLTGESVDVSVLSPAEFREFSTQLEEERNAERGINPVIYNNEAYINPDNYMMMNYDGHPDMNETIQMYLPVVGKDGEGNLQILNQNGQTITVANSADVDWNMVVTDPNDSRIDWPNLPATIDGGLNEITYRLSDHPRNKNKTFIVPAILMDKTMGNIFMDARGKGMIPTFRFLTVADTDKNGAPILFRLSLVMPASTMLSIEGDDFLTKALGVSVFEEDSFYVNLQENSVYYMGINQDQDFIWDERYDAAMDAYQGLTTDNEIVSFLTHQEPENTQNIMLLPPSLLIQKK